MDKISITVRESCGAYVTNTVQGRRASATMSPQAAAERLAGKLCGDRLMQLRWLGQRPDDKGRIVDRFVADARPAPRKEAPGKGKADIDSGARQ